MWCGFLFGASKPELVGAAIQKVWGESARAEQATYQEAKTTFQNHMRCHKNTTLTALEAWITSEMKTLSICYSVGTRWGWLCQGFCLRQTRLRTGYFYLREASPFNEGSN